MSYSIVTDVKIKSTKFINLYINLFTIKMNYFKKIQNNNTTLNFFRN